MAFEDIVRPAQTPTRSPGYKPPASTGRNNEPGQLVIGGEEGGAVRDSRIVRNDGSQDFYHWPIRRSAFLVTQEICGAKPVSGSVTVPLDAANIFVFDVSSENLSITFGGFPELPDEQSRSGWASALRCVTIELVLRWLAASTSRSVTIAGAKVNDGEALQWATSAGAIDVVICQIFSNGTVLVFQPGSNMGTPT